MAKKVLVVDDEKLIVKGIRFSLEQDGMQVDCAYDGQEAIDLATNNKYDIILLRKEVKNMGKIIAVSNQKGGVGKSTFTVLLASYLHYIVGHDVLVVDCDYPQWSIHAQRERELSLIEHDDYHKLLLVRQFKGDGPQALACAECMPPEAPKKSSGCCKAATIPVSFSTTCRERSMPKVSFGCSRRWTLSLCP